MQTRIVHVPVYFSHLSVSYKTHDVRGQDDSRADLETEGSVAMADK